MALHTTLMNKKGAYAYWHTIPYISVIHFIALIGGLSFMATTIMNSFSAFIVERSIVSIEIAHPAHKPHQQAPVR